MAEFAERGGCVILANDFDQGNSLLDDLLPGIRFSEEEVMDLSFEEDPWIVACHSLSQDQLVQDIDRFELNQPAGLLGLARTLANPAGSQNAQILAASSAMSWLDTHGDGEWGRDEARGPFPVLARIGLGQGTIILLSDPSVLINQMMGEEGNQRLYDNLVSYLAGEGITRIYIDEEHHATMDPSRPPQPSSDRPRTTRDSYSYGSSSPWQSSSSTPGSGTAS